MSPRAQLNAMQKLLDQLSTEMVRLQTGLSELTVVLERTRKRHGIAPREQGAQVGSPPQETRRE